MANTIKLFDKNSGELLSEYSGHINREYRLDSCLDHSDKYVLSGSENGMVYIWDLVEGGLVAKLDHGPGSGAIHSLAQHPSRAQLLTAHKGMVTVWEDKEQEKEVEEEAMSSASVYDSKPHWL